MGLLSEVCQICRVVECLLLRFTMNVTVHNELFKCVFHVSEKMFGGWFCLSQSVGADMQAF